MGVSKKYKMYTHTFFTISLPLLFSFAARKENASKAASKAARAGLASKEDIAQGKTKLTTVKDVREMGGNLSELLPYKEIMLIHVKGEKIVS